MASDVSGSRKIGVVTGSRAEYGLLQPLLAELKTAPDLCPQLIVSAIVEKPVRNSMVNACIYVLEPDVARIVPKDRAVDMPDVFDLLLARKRRVAAFPIREYWVDVGRVEDLHRANEEYLKIFASDDQEPAK